MKQYKIDTIEFGKPLKIIESLEIDSDEKESSNLDTIGETLKEYKKSIQKLKKDKYANQKDLIPTYLQKPCNIYVFICNDGILIRYDEAQEEDKVLTAFIEKDLFEIAPMFSDFVIHFPRDFSNYSPERRGPQIEMKKGNNNNPQAEVSKIFEYYFEVFARAELPEGFVIAPPPNRPPALISLSNEVTFNMTGQFIRDDITPREIVKEEQFVIESNSIKLPVGWLAIEVYPLLPDKHWKPEYTSQWAELDILAILAQKNIKKTELIQLDSRNAARKSYLKLFTEFESLLGGLEEPMHQFLKAHPELLCLTSVKCWSKVPFGDKISDFVFREEYNDYLLVEIEAPIRELFRKDGQQRQELTHALHQIADWVQYIQDNKQKVEQELGLAGISTNPRILVVIGRSESLTGENRKKIETLQSLQNKLRIMTYDDVLLNAKESLSRILGSFDIQVDNGEIYFLNK